MDKNFNPKIVFVPSLKSDHMSMGRACCGGSCIGGNCKTGPENVIAIFESWAMRGEEDV